MLRYKQYAPLALVLLIGIVFQLLLIAGDSKKTPSDAVISFSEAYFMLDSAMGDYLCKKLRSVGGIDVVSYYLDAVAREAKERGYLRGYMKTRLYDIRTTIMRQDDQSAEVRLTGLRRFAMNPLYDLVGQLFGFTKAHHVEAVLSVVKEGSQWKVCGSPFRFPAEI